MRRSRMGPIAVLGLCAGLTLGVACDGDFNFSFTFVVPDKAEATETRDVEVAAGTEIHVTNDIGSTRVTVDPQTAQIRIEVLKTAWADTQEAADELLSLMQVTTETVDGVFRIRASRPAMATSDASEFNLNISEDGAVSISAIVRETRVSTYRLRITLPPGHPVKIRQVLGDVKVVGLNAPGEINADAGAVRATACDAVLRVQGGTGDVIVQNHRGGLDVSLDVGSAWIQIDLLRADESVVVDVDAGDIRALLPGDLDADLYARTQAGAVALRDRQFDRVTFITERRREVRVQLNDGGPDINLTTAAGDIFIRGE